MRFFTGKFVRLTDAPRAAVANHTSHCIMVLDLNDTAPVQSPELWIVSQRSGKRTSPATGFTVAVKCAAFDAVGQLLIQRKSDERSLQCRQFTVKVDRSPDDEKQTASPKKKAESAPMHVIVKVLKPIKK